MAASRHRPDEPFSYRSAGAFDAALKARFATAAEATKRPINELRRQFAYDRLLTRVFTMHPERWILKGGAGLLARLPDQARHSMDIDLYYQGQTDAVTADLSSAADIDLKDYFAFDVEHIGQLDGIHPGNKYRVVVFLGEVNFVTFGVDSVVATNMTAKPEEVEPLSPIDVPGLVTMTYRAYPTVDHVADKHAAMITTFNGSPSSRYRDLVDLALIATTQALSADDLTAAVHSEYAYRGLSVPSSIELPSSAWEEGYDVEAAKTPGSPPATATEAIAVVRTLLEPVLNKTAFGMWNPDDCTWR